ncbi:hypothetical protein Zmor_026306 [Zophobas morio]|uniref:Uncharacterized protein n=1 Tax=Zophobas morio TaxID=2755281 RepID=A0AA38HU23_9CUCU|nr:hypothetical protein Zmor_026306 [Zophobas morio]
MTVDPVKELLRLGNEEFKLKQRYIEVKPVRLITCQNYKHCNEVDQCKKRFSRRKKAVVEDDEWTDRFRKDQKEHVNIGPFLRWKEDGKERSGWLEISHESPSFKALWAQWSVFSVSYNFEKTMS